MKSLLRAIFAAAVVGLVFSSVTGQLNLSETPAYATPVVWTSYNMPSQNLIFSFPKLPVVRQFSDPCSQTEGARYFAYARDTVYELEWNAKSTTPVPDSCLTKTRFSKKNYDEKLKSFTAGYSESEEMVFGVKAKVLTWDMPGYITTRWLVWDVDRWLHLAVTRRKYAVNDETRFIRGLALSTPQAIDIKGGAAQILGDEDVEEKKLAPDEKITNAFVILIKPRAAYTEEARLACVQGSVLLRVTFLYNGGIGPISIIRGLPYGLTEQTIAAVKAVAFLPAKADGKPVTVVKQVEYSFSIY